MAGIQLVASSVRVSDKPHLKEAFDWGLVDPLRVELSL